MSTLGQLIRDAVAGVGDEPDLDEVAKHVVNQIKPEDIPDILLALVRRQVVSTLHVMRTRDFTCAPEKMSLPAAGQGRTSRAVAARDRWLGMIVCIDEVAAKHKRLAACTLADVRAVVANREAKAHEFQTEANRFKHLGEIMAAEKADLVGSLSPAALDLIVSGWRS